METTLVVLLNYDEQTIQLFGEFNRIISFQDAFLLPTFLADKEVLYITQGELLSGDDIIATVQSLIIPVESEKRYVHSKVDNYLRVQDVRLTFAGPRDCKALDKYGYDIFEKSAELRKLLQQDKIEVISESKALELKKPIPNPKLKDQALDSILLTQSVHSFQSEEDPMFSDEENEIKADGPEEITEAEQMIRRGYGKSE